MEQPSAHVRIYALWGGFFLLLLASSLLLRHTLSAVLTSLATAYLLNPLMKYMEERAGFPRWLSLILLYFVVLTGCFFASFVMVPYIGNQIDLLTISLPGYIQNLKKAVDVWRTELSFYYSQDEIAWLTGQATEILNHLATEVSGKGYERVKGLGFALFDLLLAPILVFFLLSYKESAKKFLIGHMPEGTRSDLVALGNKINRTLERFLFAMLLDCILVGILCSAALYLLGIDFALLNGMIAGFSTLVPFIGATISIIPPILIGYLNTGDIMIIPKICGVYFLIHVIVEGNLIKPLLMRGALHLNPLAVIFALMALGEIMGFWGVVLAVPLTAVIKICSDDIHAMMLRGDDVKES
jgi:predicted PurR-regulated permease PerM